MQTLSKSCAEKGNAGLGSEILLDYLVWSEISKYLELFGGLEWNSNPKIRNYNGSVALF